MHGGQPGWRDGLPVHVGGIDATAEQAVVETGPSESGRARLDQVLSLAGRAAARGDATATEVRHVRRERER